jgi:hypothetical protein
MDWLAQNWVWVVILVLFIGMHLFGHGGHGGHSGEGDEDDQRPAGVEQPGKGKTQGHHH